MFHVELCDSHRRKVTLLPDAAHAFGTLLLLCVDNLGHRLDGRGTHTFPPGLRGNRPAEAPPARPLPTHLHLHHSILQRIVHRNRQVGGDGPRRGRPDAKVGALQRRLCGLGHTLT